MRRLTIDDAPDPSPFVALEDRYPDGEEDVPDIDGAHAMIVRPKTVANKADWLVALADAARRFPISDDEPGSAGQASSEECQKTRRGDGAVTTDGAGKDVSPT